MKTSPLIVPWVLLVASLSTLVASAAGVSGRVVLRGTPPPEKPIQMTSDCAAAQKSPPTTRHYVVNPEGGLANVFVTIRSGLERRTFPTPTNAVVMECVACQLQPYVVAVQVGQPLVVRNDSGFLENLHITSRNNPEGNHALGSGRPFTKRFNKAEEFIRIKGDSHPWFFGYVSVVDHPYFAVTDREGRFQLPNGLPDGTYTLEARHLKAGAVKQEITVRNETVDPITLTLEVR